MDIDWQNVVALGLVCSAACYLGLLAWRISGQIDSRRVRRLCELRRKGTRA